MKKGIGEFCDIRARLILAATVISFVVSCGGGGGGSVSVGTGGGSSSGGEVVEPANELPSANAGEDASSADLMPVTLDGINSTDPDGSIVSYSWTQVENGAPVVTIEDQSAQQVTVNLPDVFERTTFEFQLTVVDDRGGEGTDTVEVNVRDLNCADNLADISDTGVLTTSVTGDFLPLCNSEIFVSNQLLNQVELINVDTGELVSSYQLSSAPTDLEYDKESGKLYVGLSAATFFAVIDTINDTVDYVQTRDVVYQISLDDAGGLFLSTGKDRYYKSLYKLDSDSIWSGPWPIAGSAFGYNNNRNEIVTGTFGLSPVTLTRYGFDDLGELIELESLRTGGGNGQDLAISNDGRSFALAAGGGNGLGYTIFDYSSEDLSVTFGEWVTGAYPSGVAFSPDDSIVATSNYSSLILFNRFTHAELMRKDIPACDYGNASKVRFSKGGALAFIKQTCGFDDETVKIYYFKIPQG